MKRQKFYINKPKKFVYEKDEKKNVKLKELKPFSKYYFKFKGTFSIICLLLIITGALSIVVPIFSAKMIALFGENFDSNLVLKYAGIVLGLLIINAILNFILNKLWILMSINSSYAITRDLLKKLNNTTQKSIDNAGSGTFTTRMYGDVQVVGDAPLRLSDYLISSLSALGFVTYLFTLTPYVAIYVILYLATSLGLDFYKINMRTKNRKVIKKIGEKENSFRNENIRGIKDLRGINANQNVSDRLMDITKEKHEYELESNNKMQTINFIRRTIKNILDFSLIAMCVYLVLNDGLELATLMVVYNFRGRITNFSEFMVSVKDYLSDCTLSASRLNEIFDDEKYPVEKFGEISLDNFKGEITFKNVNFSYFDNEVVLDNISFDIKPNTITSFVGLSGSGKNTIISLMNKLYELPVENGQILLDQTNINSLTKDSLRNNVSVISQSPYLFNMTIAENMRLAKPEATDEEIIEVLKSAKIYDFVETLPDKLNSKLGENGIKVSGGQKQRLAIARALLTNSKVLIFDEATSALDNLNQKAIKDVIKDLSKQHTIIMVAHRLSTVVDSDNIIVIKDGKVLEQGTHENLMDNCDYYKSLYIEEDIDK